MAEVVKKEKPKENENSHEKLELVWQREEERERMSKRYLWNKPLWNDATNRDKKIPAK